MYHSVFPNSVILIIVKTEWHQYHHSVFPSILKNIGVNPDIFAKNIPENYVAKNNWDEDLTLKTRTRKYKQPEKKKRQNNAEVEELLKESPLELHEENYHPRMALEDQQVRDKMNGREMTMNTEIEMEDLNILEENEDIF